jgi:tryptophanyl-tRNA synthetase
VRKIRKAVTDSTSLVSYDPEKRPGVSTLVDIECACTNKELEEVAENALLNGLDTGEYKKHVAKVLVEHLKPIQSKYMHLMSNQSLLRDFLAQGAQKANEIAKDNYSQVCKLIGMN